MLTSSINRILHDHCSSDNIMPSAAQNFENFKVYLFLENTTDFKPNFEACPLKLGSLHHLWIAQVARVRHELSRTSFSNIDKLACRYILPTRQAINCSQINYKISVSKHKTLKKFLQLSAISNFDKCENFSACSKLTMLQRDNNLFQNVMLCIIGPPMSYLRKSCFYRRMKLE